MRKADLAFPLAQFQAVEADREGLFELVSAVNRALGDQQLAASLLVNIFSGLWSNFEAVLRALPPAQPSVSRTHRSDRELLEDVLDGVQTLRRNVGGTTSLIASTVNSGDWEDYYIRGVNFANTRGGHETDLGALRAYSEAIALAPLGLPDNQRSRLYAYRGAILKRLGRLDEAQQDLLLAQKWAREEREIKDALYNLAGVAALGGRQEEALSLLHELISKDSQWARSVATNKYFASLHSNPDFRRLTRNSPLEQELGH